LASSSIFSCSPSSLVIYIFLWISPSLKLTPHPFKSFFTFFIFFWILSKLFTTLTGCR
jgi:hypothetical protein